MNWKLYTIDATDAQILLTYSEVFEGDKPNLIEEIKKINMHKALSIISELIRVRDAYKEPVKTDFVEFSIPLEMVLKNEMCDIVPTSPEELKSNKLLRKNVHIISVQMMLILLKYIFAYGDFESMKDIDYRISKEDYQMIIKLQLIVAEIVSDKHEEGIDTDHFLYSTYHLNYQRNVANELLRMYYMLEVISQDKNNFAEDIQNEFRYYYNDFASKYMFTPTEYSSILFWQLAQYYSGINGLTYNSIWTNINESYGNSPLTDLANKVISTLCKPIKDYEDWSKQSLDLEWDFSEFFSFPVIQDEENNIVSISDITLRNAFFEKIFWLIRDCYPKQDSRAMAFFGRLYEKYIQDVTENAVIGEYEYIDEFSYTENGNAKKSSDVYIKKENELLVVEAKGFSVLLDCMIKNERVDDNNKKLFVDPILQADASLTSVLDKKTEFEDVETAYIVSVTMDNINAVPNYYNSIHNEISENKKCAAVKYFYNLNIEEYEMLLYLMECGNDIFSLLKEYFDSSKLKPFSTYIQDKYSDIGMTKFMKKYYKDASDKMKSLLFS
ncbi:hypothetical protein KGF41_15545 [Clostridioides sp. ZZV14-6150]|uniref:hypothetical protein n=1 Tax=Clostridioides sp. ZZV14-6150 TaxID=2811493 RepID=UPI001D120013|nr:hypothetical protein [Clostridioides sp. ZZV14-6150]